MSNLALQDRQVSIHRRVRHGLRKPHNWLQLAKFCAVGLSGYAVNLAVFSVAVQVLSVHHLIAATMAFCVAVTNNFWWNRHWTFKAGNGHAGFQAARFLAVSTGAFIIQATILELLVDLVRAIGTDARLLGFTLHQSVTEGGDQGG